MNERENLFALRKKLVSKRRALVESYVASALDQLTGESLSRIQSAIDAVDRAAEDERRAADIGKDIGVSESQVEEGAAVPAVKAVPFSSRAVKGPSDNRPK